MERWGSLWEDRPWGLSHGEVVDTAVYLELTNTIFPNTFHVSFPTQGHMGDQGAMMQDLLETERRLMGLGVVAPLSPLMRREHWGIQVLPGLFLLQGYKRGSGSPKPEPFPEFQVIHVSKISG